eukprot:jgi/Botrbrau1/20828/Bobra.0156s0053.1
MGRGKRAGNWNFYLFKNCLWIYRLFVPLTGPSPSSTEKALAIEATEAQGHPDPLRVTSAYRDRVILITGVSGYVGSLVLEQLLRLCNDVEKVYVIIRPKQGRDAQQRMEKMLQGPIFRKLRHQLPEIEEKIHVISGDVTAPNLGLSAPNRVRIASEVHFIIHCAADIHFNRPLADSLKANYRPTKELLACLDGLYLGPHKPDILVGLMKGTRLLKASGLANTYMLAKNFTERLVLAADRNPVPVCIVRPSGIGALAGEPCPGYIGNPSGMTAFILAWAAGGLTAKENLKDFNLNSVAGMVPADCVSSTILAATIAAAEDLASTPKIYHVCSSASHPHSVVDARLTVLQYFKEDPPSASAKTLLEGWREARDEQLEWQDYNLHFDVTNTLALQKRLSGPEEAGLSCVWLPTAPVNWNRYFRTYSAGVKHTYLREKPKAGLKEQDYVP